MNITYILLSPTFGMHQYTADLANRADQWSGVRRQWSGVRGREADNLADSHSVRLITTTTLPRDRYGPAVQVITPLTTHGTGFSREGLDLAAYRRIQSAIRNSQSAIYHFTGVHLWNLPLVYQLRRRGVPVMHTLHDPDPHHGVRFGGLIRLWNRLIIASGCHILVHGRCYRDRLIAEGVRPDRVTYTPLLHGFLSAAHPWPPLHSTFDIPHSTFDIPHSTVDIPHSTSFTALFFGRVEAYKGVDILLEAWKMLKENAGERHFVLKEGKEVREVREVRETGEFRLIIAGRVAPGVMLPPLPADVELRDRRIMDDEADALFRAADVLVLPYRDATQSALVAAAYAYGLPVIVTRAGALPEYVVEGETGWIVPPEDPAALASALAAARDAAACCGMESKADAAACCGTVSKKLAPMRMAARAWFDARRREEEAILAEMYTRLLRP